MPTFVLHTQPLGCVKGTRKVMEFVEEFDDARQHFFVQRALAAPLTPDQQPLVFTMRIGRDTLAEFHYLSALSDCGYRNVNVFDFAVSPLQSKSGSAKTKYGRLQEIWKAILRMVRFMLGLPG